MALVIMSIREDKAFLLTGIFFFLGCLSLYWLLFSFLMSAEKPLWFWLVSSAVSVLSAGLTALFIVLLVGRKTIVTEQSISKVAFGKMREIPRKDISRIADIPLGKGDRFYVVYPKGYDETLVEKHISPCADSIERTKAIQKDLRLLVIRKTKKTTEILSKFGYTTMAVL